MIGSNRNQGMGHHHICEVFDMDGSCASGDLNVFANGT